MACCIPPQYCPPPPYIPPVAATTLPLPLGPTALLGVDTTHCALPDHAHPLPLIVSPFTPAPGVVAVGDTTQQALEKIAGGAIAPSVANPLALGVADSGTLDPYSREDHVHPLPLMLAPYTPAVGVVAVGDTTQEALEKLDVIPVPLVPVTDNYDMSGAGGAAVIVGARLVDGGQTTVSISASVVALRCCWAWGGSRRQPGTSSYSNTSDFAWYLGCNCGYRNWGLFDSVSPDPRGPLLSHGGPCDQSAHRGVDDHRLCLLRQRHLREHVKNRKSERNKKIYLFFVFIQ